MLSLHIYELVYTCC